SRHWFSGESDCDVLMATRFIRGPRTMHHAFRLTALMAAVGCLSSAIAQQGTSQPVTSQMLLDGLKDPTKWLMFGGDYTSQRHSPLTQLTPQNVDRLTPQWLFQ